MALFGPWVPWLRAAGGEEGVPRQGARGDRALRGIGGAVCVGVAEPSVLGLRMVNEDHIG